MLFTTGPFSHADREFLAETALHIAPLPLPGCRDLGTALTCLAQATHPAPAALHGVAQRARQVRAALLIEAAPERWIDVVGEDAQDLVAELIAERQAQAARLARVANLCEPARAGNLVAG
jgi:hypothetical protein